MRLPVANGNMRALQKPTLVYCVKPYGARVTYGDRAKLVYTFGVAYGPYWCLSPFGHIGVPCVFCDWVPNGEEKSQAP